MSNHRARTALVALVVLAVSCTDEQRRAFGEEDARDALRAAVEQAVRDEDLELDGELDCVADIATTDGALTATCDGAATSGAPVSGTFTGTADVDAETCQAQLLVDVDDRPVVERDDVDCFAAS